MGMSYSKDQISQWAQEGQAISPYVALELLEQNSLLESLIMEAIGIIEAEDPILLRRMDVTALREWKEKVNLILATS